MKLKTSITVILVLSLLSSCRAENKDFASSLEESSISEENSVSEENSPRENSNDHFSESSEEVLEVFYEEKEPIRFLYGKSILTDGEKTAYEAIDTAVRSFSPSVDLTGVTEEEIRKILEYYLSDNPDIYQLSNSYKLISRGEKKRVEFSYSETPRSYNKKMAEISSACEEILKALKNRSDYEKALSVHDFLCQTIAYEKGENAYSIYGALVEKKAVCEGYSKAFKYIMEKLGCRALVVYGNAEKTLHSWNMAEISGRFYHLDVTNDDSQSGIIYSHFLITEEEMSAVAIPDKARLPKADYKADNYYIKEGLYFSEYNPSKLERLLSNMSGSVLPLRFSTLRDLQSAKSFILSRGFSVITPKTGIENKIYDLTIIKRLISR